MAYGTVRTVCMAFAFVCDFQSIRIIIFSSHCEKGYSIMDSPYWAGVGTKACVHY